MMDRTPSIPRIPERALQGLYEQACWRGYALHKGRRLSGHEIWCAARVELQYFCPA
jgi:hypothetical protein